MAQPPVDPPRRGRGRRRRWWKVVAVLMALLAIAVAALPWVLSTSAGRRWLLARADATLAPARLEVGSFAFSWFRPTVMTDFVIRDHQGEKVVASPRAEWDRNLWQILFERPRYGTLKLHQGVLDVERFADGKVDLYEALRPILTGRPETSLRVLVVGGTLRLRSPELAEPIEGRHLDLTIDRPAAPTAITWRLAMDRAKDDRDRSPDSRLRCVGRYERWRPDGAGNHPLSVDLEANHWPLALGVAGVELRGLLGGSLQNRQSAGRWHLTGDATLMACDVSGPRLAGDRIQLDRVTGTWDVAQAEAGWSIERLDLDSTLATLKATGPLPAPEGAATRLEGRLDLAELARQAPRALRLRDDLTLDRGEARLVVAASSEGTRPVFDVTAELAGLAATHRGKPLTLDGPARLSAHLLGGSDELEVAWLDVETAFLKARGEGDVDRGVTVRGTVDLAELRRQARDLIDLGGIELAGSGRLEGDYRRLGGSYAGRLTLDLTDLALGGDGSGAVRSDSVRLTATLRGPADAAGLPRGGGQAAAAGLPRGWGRATLAARTDETTANLIAWARDDRLEALSASAESPVKVRGVPAVASAWMVARRDGDGWAVDEATVGLDRADGAQGARVECRTTGRYDPKDGGTLTLVPVTPLGRGQAIALAPEGIRAVGLWSPDWRVGGRLVGDAPALAGLSAAWSAEPGPVEPSGIGGSWSARADAWGGEEGAVRFFGKLEVPDLTWPSGEGRRGPGPLAIDLAGSYRSASDEVAFTELVLSSPYVALEASGRVIDLGGSPSVDLKGRLSPDFVALTALLSERVEPGAKIAGGPRPFALRGTIGADDPLAGLEGELGFTLEVLDVYGLKVGSTPFVARLDHGRVAIDPVRSTLNGGSLSLDPEVVRRDDGGWTLRLRPGSAIEGAEVNDEVSRRVLSFVAPVLDRATRVHGRVSAEVGRAEFPIGPGLSQGTVVEGRVVFDDVAFVPGPLAEGLIGLVGAEARVLKLDEPVVLSIADGRVYQRGLALPLGNLTRVELEGFVGFDRSLALTAGLPITRTMVANNDFLGDVVEGTRVAVPIRGTLSDPEIDREAFRTALKDLGGTLLRRSAARGAAELILRMARPREPSAPRPSAAERREMRRRRRQGLPQ